MKPWRILRYPAWSKVPRENPLPAHRVYMSLRDLRRRARQHTTTPTKPSTPAGTLWEPCAVESARGWQTRVMSLSPALPSSLTDLARLLYFSSLPQFAQWENWEGGVTCVLVPHVQPLLPSTIFWGCQPDWTLRKGPDNSRRAERKVWGQTRVRPTAAAAFESFLTRAEVRATPLSEMARWKRFLARGDNTWKDRVEKGSLCSQEGGRLFFQSHTHPQPCPGLFPWRPRAGLL